MSDAPVQPAMPDGDSALDPRNPDVAPDYQILGRLGSGGMGVVYHAVHRTSGAEVALKTVTLPSPHMLSGIRREIRALTRLSHPGIVRVVDSGVDRGVPWYAMELLRGPTLRDLTNALWNDANDSEASWPTAIDTPQDTAGHTLGASAHSVAREREILSRAITLALSQSPAPPVPVREATEPTRVGGHPDDAGAPTRSNPKVIAGRERAARRGLAAGAELRAALTLARRLCAPLAYLHGEGLVHRDLKPENIFIRDDGTPVMVDFGLVSHLGAATGRDVLEVGGVLEGTLAYMSPEQLRGELVDARSDLYALGCILYELLTGRQPFESRALSDALHAHLDKRPEPPSFLVEGISPALEELVLRLLEKQPRDRVGHADAVAATLAELGAELPESAAPSRPYLYRARFVGRQQQVEQVLDRIFAAPSATVPCLLLGGESGAGKTRLAVEVARVARVRGLRVVTSECQPRLGNLGDTGIKAAPLAALRPALQIVADSCHEGGPLVTESIIGHRAKVLAAIEPTLYTLPGSERHPEPARLPADAARVRLLTYLGETLSALAAHEPTLLIIDDLQWADELTLSFLSLLQARFFPSMRLVVLATYRSDETNSSLEPLILANKTARLNIGRLDDASVREMMRDMTAADELPEALVRFVVERSQGNPFFVAEYLRAAVTEGVLRRDAVGRWRAEGLDNLTPQSLPDSVHGILARRLERLSPVATQLVEALSVLGSEADLEVLAALAEAGALAVLDGIEELRVAQMVEEVDGGVRLVHDRLRRATYDRLMPAHRTSLHRRAAQLLEAYWQQHGRLAQHYLTLAQHLRAGGEPARALGYLERAGDQGMETGAYGDATRSFEQALRLAAELAGNGEPVAALRVAHWDRQLGEAFLAQGRMPESRTHLLRAVTRLGLGPAEGAVKARLDTIRQAVSQLAHRVFPERWFLGARKTARGELLEAARAYHSLLQVGYFMHDSAGMLDSAVRMVNLAELAGPCAELAVAYASMFGIAGLVPVHSLAESYAEKAYRMARQAGDGPALQWVLTMDAVYRLGLADWQRATRVAEEGRALATELGARRRFDEMTGVMATLSFLRGDLEASAGYAAQQLESSGRGDPQVGCWGHLHRAQVRLENNEVEDAWQDLQQANELVTTHNLNRPERVWSQALTGVAALRRDRPDEALRAAQQAAEVIALGPPIVWYCIHAYGCVADVFTSLLAAAQKSGAPATSDLGRRAQAACKTLSQCARVLPAARPRAARLDARLETLLRGGKQLSHQ